ncbi:MAG: Mur ligase family protein [Butyricicoccaceae bacterium]
MQGIGRCPAQAGRGGTNLPGKLALKIDKNILGELSRGVKVTVVTGTNGKTTTSRMIEQAFADAGLKYFSNKSGANLLTGIIAVFAQHSTLSGKCPYTHALIECDEAAFRRTSEYLPRRMPGRATTSSATSSTATARSRTRSNAIREGITPCARTRRSA